MILPSKAARLMCGLILLSNAVLSIAAAEDKITFDIPGQSLSKSLLDFSQASGYKILFNENLTRDIQAQHISGLLTGEEGLRQLLDDNGLTYRFTSSKSVIIERAGARNLSAEMLLAQVPQENYLAVTESTEMPDAGPVEQDDLMVSGREMNGYSVIDASTATKTDTPIMETPFSIEVVTEDVLQDQQAFRLQDALKNVSGVQQRFEGGGFDNFIVRGFDLGTFHYRDGVRIPSVNFDLANIQQVEVLKGPTSSLYGRTEPGGLINAVTKRPSADSFYNLEQRFGSYDFYRTQADATGAITKDESLLYRVDFSYLNTNSFREFSFTDRVFVAPSLTWKPREDTEFNLTVEYLNEDRVYDSGLPAIGNKIANIPITRQFDTPGMNDTHENTLVDFNWSHNFNENWKIRNGVVAMYYDQEWNETYAGGLQADNRSLERFAWFGESDTDMHTVFLNLTGQFNTFSVDHTVLLGGDYYNQHTEAYATDNSIGIIDIFNPVFPSNLNLSQFDNLPIEFFRDQQGGFYSNREDTWSGIYFQDQLSFFDGKLNILGGGRYDWATVELDSAYFSPLSSSKDSDTHFSPRVGMTYRPWNWLSIYGNYVESFGANNNGVSITGQAFKPQTAEQYEAGLKTDFFEGRLTSTLAFYHLTKDNVLTPDPSNPNFSLPIGEARSQGIEIDISGQITAGLSMIATYAYTDARITKDNSGNQGNRLPYVPEHAGSVWLKYEFQQVPLQGFSAGGGVFAASKREGDAANSFHDGSYARLDLFGAYRHKIGPTIFTTQLNINNVTGTEYFTLRDRARNLPAEPLTVIGSIRIDY